MTPFFIISTPRSRSTLLMRMLDATAGVRCSGESTGLLAMLRKLDAEPERVWHRHGSKETFPMHRQHVDTAAWREAVRAMLPAWVNPRSDDTHYGVRSSFLGREGWEKAVDEWSWLLETWPEAKIIFLGREQGEVEISMMMTSDLWRPAYGTCPGVCGGRVHHHLRSMQDFHRLNPSRTVCIDAEEIADHAVLRGKLDRVGIPLDAAAHAAELAVVSGSRQQLRKREEAPAKPVETSLADKLFDPATTYEQALALVSPATLEVHTLRWGDMPWMGPCSAAMEAWCRRHGYPLKVHAPDPAEPVGKFSTLAILREFLAGGAQSMIFLDADVMIHAAAPAWSEGAGFRARPDVPGKAVEDWMQWQAEHCPDKAGVPWTYCNSGVWSCDRAAAERFLQVAAAGSKREGYQEQHQFNFWWREAVGKGMEFGHLPNVWNVIASLEPRTAGYFIHFAGRKKEGMLRRFRRGEWPFFETEEQRFANFLADPFGDLALNAKLSDWKPAKPWAFPRMEPRHDRAIICPWLSKDAAWGEEELRLAMRSWDLRFTDKDCPIYILGDRAPKFMREGGRLKFIRIDYSKGREAGLRAAYATGLQIAREVILTNDDFYLLKETSWDDLRVALRLGRLDVNVEERLASGDGWQRTLGTVCRDLQKKGRHTLWNFATHTPFLYERDKAIEVLEKFHLRYRGSFENLYHNWHGTPSRNCGKLRTRRLPAPEARFLYHHDNTLTGALKAGLRAAFPDPAPWEMAADQASAIPRKIHQTWADRNIPRQIYPEAWTASWKLHHPGWVYKLWTDKDLLALARKDYPEFSELLATASGVVKADVGRLLVLHRHGGLYADLDYLALGPMDHLLADTGFHFCELPGGWASNALLACAPGDPLALAMAREALARWQRKPRGRVEWIGGPDLLAEMAKKHPVVRWRPADVCPLDWRGGEHEVPWIPERADGAMAVTFWRHNW